MRWERFGSLFVCVILALSLVIVGLIKGLDILYAFALAVLSAGLGASSLMISLNTDKRTNIMEATLTRIESLQEEINKAQEEQPSSNKPLLATLEGLSQYYLDYIANQKSTDEK